MSRYDPMAPPPRVPSGGRGSGVAPPTGPAVKPPLTSGAADMPAPPRATDVPSGSGANPPAGPTPLPSDALNPHAQRDAMERASAGLHRALPGDNPMPPEGLPDHGSHEDA